MIGHDNLFAAIDLRSFDSWAGTGYCGEAQNIASLSGCGAIRSFAMRLRPPVIVVAAVLLAVQAQGHLAPAGRDNTLVVVFFLPAEVHVCRHTAVR
jgi:hypothetical protein